MSTENSIDPFNVLNEVGAHSFVLPSSYPCWASGSSCCPKKSPNGFCCLCWRSCSFCCFCCSCRWCSCSWNWCPEEAGDEKSCSVGTPNLICASPPRRCCFVEGGEEEDDEEDDEEGYDVVALGEKTCVEIYNARAERTRMMMRSDKNEVDDGVVPCGVECVDGRLWVIGECSCVSAWLASSFSLGAIIFFLSGIRWVNTRSWELSGVEWEWCQKDELDAWRRSPLPLEEVSGWLPLF